MKILKFNVGRYPTHVLASDNAKVLTKDGVTRLVSVTQQNCVLLIPGNPGGLAYYVPFCEKLEQKLGKEATIIAVDHCYHSKRDSWADEFYGKRN
jgi:hypothetical protein